MANFGKKVKLNHVQWDILLNLIMREIDEIEIKIKNETNPTAKFDLKMMRSDLDDILLNL